MSISQHIPSEAELKRVTGKDPVRRMHQVYGERVVYSCESCCNCQKPDRHSEKPVCIAYSPTVPWDRQSRACYDLYNIPFRGLRPRIRPLEELLPKNDADRAADRCSIEGQDSLF